MSDAIEVARQVLDGWTVLTIMSSNGDDQLACDPRCESGVKCMIESFDNLMETGYVAFGFDSDGNQCQQINKRDWQKLDRQEARKALFDEPREFHLVAPVVGG